MMRNIRAPHNRMSLACVDAFVLVLLAGCSTTQQYKRAAHELHTAAPHLWCWASTGLPSSKPGDMRCDVSDASSADESNCIQTLSESATHRPGLGSAKKGVETCMLGKGWTRIPLATYWPAKEVPNCRIEDDPLVWCLQKAE